MQILEGRYYKTRSGETIGPMVWDSISELWRRPNFVRNSGDYWHKDGMRMGHVEDDLDLVERVDAPPRS